MVTPEEFVSSMRGLAKDTKIAYLRRLNYGLDIFPKSLGDPNEITQDDVWNFIEDMADLGWSSSHRKDIFSLVKRYLGRNKCDAVLLVNPIWPYEERNVEWLDRPEAIRAWEAACLLGPNHRVLMALCLWGMLRQIEVKRFTIKDSLDSKNTLKIRGKGRGGEKIRRIAKSQFLEEEINRYENTHREALIQLSKARDWQFDPADQNKLILVKYHKRLKAVGKNLPGEWANEIFDVAGIEKTGTHTFRRSGARFLWEDGIPVETISAILGHSDTKTTMRYIGVDVHHMAAALEDFNPMQLIKNKETEINE